MKKWTKLFSLAIGALMAIGAAVGVRQTVERVNAEDNKITTLAGIKSGNKYYIGATTSETDYYFYADGSSTTASTAGTAKTNKNEAAALTFTQVTNGWNIQFASGNYLGLKNGKDNGKVQVLSTAATFTIEEVTDKGLLKLSNNNYCVQKNNSGAQFGSYGNTQTNVWLAVASSEQQETNPVSVTSVDIVKESLTLNVGEVDTLYATVEPSNATNKGLDWSSSNESVATVDDSGKVTAVGAGTCNVIATAKDGSGESDSCSLTVTNWQNLVWNFNDYCDANGIASDAGKESQIGAEPYVYEGISLTGTTASGKTNTRFYNSGGTQDLRIYDGGTITFSANTKSLHKIVFGAGSLSSDIGEMNSNTWTYLDGTNSVTFTSSATSIIKEITIYYTEIIPDKYTVTFDANGGSFNEGKGISLEFDTGTKHDVTLPLVSDLATTPEIYTVLTGWKADETIYNAGETVEVSTFTTFVAQYSSPDFITIAQAIELAGLYPYPSKTTYKFKTTGYVTDINVAEDKTTADVTISDGKDSILIYKLNDFSRLIAGKTQYINVEGNIQSYYSKPEILSATISIITKTSVVTFNANGGVGSFDKQIIVGESSKASKPLTDPTKDGYDFGGWYLDDKAWDFDNDIVEGDMTLVACWNEKAMALKTSSQLNIKYGYEEGTIERASNLVDNRTYIFSNGSSAYLKDSLDDGKFAVTGNISQAAEIVVISTDGGYFLKLGEKYIGYGSSTNLNLVDTGYKWTVSVNGTDSEKTFRFLSAATSTRSLSYRNSNNVFGGYSTTNTSGYVFDLVLFGKTDLSISSIREYGLRFSCEFNEATVSQFDTPANWQCGFMVAQTAQMMDDCTFEDAYDILYDVLDEDDPSYIQNVANLAMDDEKSAKVSMYGKTMDQLPTPVDGMYEFSVNVTIPEANLEDSVSAVWFAYNTLTHEFVFASQKDMSIKEICGIYDDMELNDNQNAAIDYIIAQNNWEYAD